MVKWRIASRFGAKFHRIRALSLLSLGLFCLAFVLEILLFGAGRARGSFAGGDFLGIFRGLFTRELLFAMVLMLLGITVYAPALLFLSAALRGFSAGYVLSCLLPATLSFRPIAAFSAVALYLFILAFLQLGYGSFLCEVSLTLFTPPLPDRRGKDVLFGGSLFYSRYFCGRVNLRFLGSYLLFFLFYLACLALLTLLYALICLVL